MMAAWIGLVVWAVVTIARRADAHHHHPHGRAREILAERYARGELTTDEYNERLGALGP
jgi:putative membrane protein